MFGELALALVSASLLANLIADKAEELDSKLQAPSRVSLEPIGPSSTCGVSSGVSYCLSCELTLFTTSTSIRLSLSLGIDPLWHEEVDGDERVMYWIGFWGIPSGS